MHARNRTASRAAGRQRRRPLDVILRVNGTEHRLSLDPRTMLLDALREHLNLTGSKKLRSRPVRRVHRADGREAGEVVPFVRRARRGTGDHNDRRPRPRRAAPCRIRGAGARGVPPVMDVIFIDEHDPTRTRPASRGLAKSRSSASHRRSPTPSSTIGSRIRELPVTPDKLL